MQFDSYDPGNFYDEFFVAPGQPRPSVELLIRRLNALSVEEVQQRQQAAQKALLKLGATFNVYSDRQGTERIFPFDILPRVVAAAEWDALERGLRQRIEALNTFLNDIYHDQKIINDGVIPAEPIYSAAPTTPIVPTPFFMSTNFSLF